MKALLSIIKKLFNKSKPVFDYSRKRQEYREGKKYTGDMVRWNPETNQYDYY